MTHLRDEIRKLTEEQSEKMWETCTFDFPDEFQEGLESAILAGIKLVLEREPTGKQNEADAENLALQLWMFGPSLTEGRMPNEAQIREIATSLRRAMTAQLLKELE